MCETKTFVLFDEDEELEDVCLSADVGANLGASNGAVPRRQLATYNQGTSQTLESNSASVSEGCVQSTQTSLFTYISRLNRLVAGRALSNR